MWFLVSALLLFGLLCACVFVVALVGDLLDVGSMVWFGFACYFDCLVCMITFSIDCCAWLDAVLGRFIWFGVMLVV